jgi:hypothetical protein
LKKELNFFDIYQNTALSIISIHSFVLGYNNVAKHKINKHDFPPLKYIFFVLPIIYDIKTMKSVKNELFTTLTKNKEFTLDLQEKAQKMSSQTMEALNLGFSKNIISIDNNFNVIIQNKYNTELTKKLKFSNDIISNIQTYSKRLGGIFAKKDEKTLQLQLNIIF